MKGMDGWVLISGASLLLGALWSIFRLLRPERRRVRG